MERAVVQEERGEQAPIFAEREDGERLERAEPMQSVGIGRAAHPDLEKEHHEIERDECGDRRRGQAGIGREDGAAARGEIFLETADGRSPL